MDGDRTPLERFPRSRRPEPLNDFAAAFKLAFLGIHQVDIVSPPRPLREGESELKRNLAMLWCLYHIRQTTTLRASANNGDGGPGTNSQRHVVLGAEGSD